MLGSLSQWKKNASSHFVKFCRSLIHDMHANLGENEPFCFANFLSQREAEKIFIKLCLDSPQDTASFIHQSKKGYFTVQRLYVAKTFFRTGRILFSFSVYQDKKHQSIFVHERIQCKRDRCHLRRAWLEIQVVCIEDPGWGALCPVRVQAGIKQTLDGWGEGSRKNPCPSAFTHPLPLPHPSLPFSPMPPAKLPPGLAAGTQECRRRDDDTCPTCDFWRHVVI